MTKLRSNCSTPGCCPGVTYYSGLRVFYNLLLPAVAPGAVAQWAQPERLTNLLVAEADGTDPSYAHVSLHALTCVRENDGSVVGSFITIPNDLNTPGLVPPVATSRDIAPVQPLPCSAFTVGRGSAAPQYRVEFRDGTSDGQVVYVDGSSNLVLPATHVKVQLATPSNGLILRPTPQQVAGVGLFVESEAFASVTWNSRTAAAAGPNGMNTWTQTQRVTLDAQGAPNEMIFERPPFARRVQIQVGEGLITPAAVLATAQFLIGGTFGFGFIPFGLIVAGQHSGYPFTDVPAQATHVEVSPIAGDAQAGQPVSVIWEIGVT